MTTHFIFDGLGLCPIMDVQVEKLLTIVCSVCDTEFPICQEELGDPEGYLIQCPKCKSRWLPPRVDFSTHPDDYKALMAVVNTDQHRGRQYRCPICHQHYWSVWGRAEKHWKSHSEEEQESVLEAALELSILVACLNT